MNMSGEERHRHTSAEHYRDSRIQFAKVKSTSNKQRGQLEREYLSPLFYEPPTQRNSAGDQIEAIKLAIDCHNMQLLLNGLKHIVLRSA